MKIIVIIVLIISVSVNANNQLDSMSNHMLSQDIKLAQHINNYSKSISGVDFFTVGADTACQYSSIQTAIDDFAQSPFGNIEIRIANNKTYIENIVIDNETLSLVGGYTDCTQAAQGGNPGNNQSIIDGNNLETVIRIEGTTQRRTIMLKNLRLLHGTNVGPGGGLVSYLSDVALSLENVDIRNNTAHYGAGIAIIAGNTDLIMRESRVLGNVADYAGGIYCSGSASSVNVGNHSGIIANFANSPLSQFPNGRGAGAYIDGCYFAIFTGSHDNGTLTGMDSNTAESHGGAIYAENAIIRLHGHQHCGAVGCLGDDTNPVSFRSNQSNFGVGAVLYAKNSDVKVNAVWMEGNVGNSILYLEASELVIERAQQPCWSNSHCNLIENNDGLVISGSNISDTNISNVIFKNNPGGVLSFGNLSSIRKVVNIESNVFYNNGSFSVLGIAFTVFDIFGAFDVSFIHNTVVDNNSSDSIFNLDWNAGVAGTVPPIFEAHSNIVDNPGAIFLTHNAISAFNGITDIDVNISALITNETDSLLEVNGVFNDAINFSGGDFITQTVPGEVLFVDRANGDLHLSPNSRAIDYFNTPSRATVTYKDIDYQDRGIDDPNNQSPISSLFFYDLGADERIEQPDLMFVDGFE